MIWQRIDENTYIDDTLVTCAEYQLFIDEMREQGKHYQPDHWTSYQFPPGQGREPILGVRYSDAVAFCEWLGQRETYSWVYRLPKEVEASEYIAKSQEIPLGYWTVGANEKYQFKWSGPIPDNIRGIAIMRSIHRYVNQNIIQYIEDDIIRAIGRSSGLDLDRTIYLALTIDRAFVLARKGARDLYLNKPHRSDLFGALTSSEKLIHAMATDISRYIVYSNRRTSDISIDLHLDRALNRGLKCDRVRAVVRARARALSRAVQFAIDHNKASDNIFDIVIDLFTLRERIAGRSPAFEGIRLVKERIR